VEIFKQISIDWLGKKWWLFSFSLLLIVLGAAGYVMRGGLTYGIDFTGGTIVVIKFKEKPDLDLIRKSLTPETPTPPLIQQYDAPSKNTVQIRIQEMFEEKKEMGSGRSRLLSVLRRTFDPGHVDSRLVDFNNAGLETVYEHLLAADPDGLGAEGKGTGETEQHYRGLAQSMMDYRNSDREGLVSSLEDLKTVPGVSGSSVAGLEKGFYAGPFAVKKYDSVGAIVGADLRNRAVWAVGFSFLGMLLYIAFRFKPIYGIAAVVAVIHDVIITVGLFAITGKEISLTVIAALLTLVGYSMNDTIVVFDRARDNLKTLRKESYSTILNLSINQTFSRTIMTSGMTFLSVFALLVFGGEVLNGFSFTLTVGIIIGTYSSIGLASPIVDWWYRIQEKKPKKKMA
jgi:preprotein translocase subunit SecF